MKNLAPCKPSQRLLLHLSRQPVQVAPPAGWPAELEEDGVWASRTGSVRRYTPGHLIDCIRAGRTVSDKKAKQNAVDNLRLWYPRTWRTRLPSAERAWRTLQTRGR